MRGKTASDTAFQRRQCLLLFHLTQEILSLQYGLACLVSNIRAFLLTELKAYGRTVPMSVISEGLPDSADSVSGWCFVVAMKSRRLPGILYCILFCEMRISLAVVILCGLAVLIYSECKPFVAAVPN